MTPLLSIVMPSHADRGGMAAAMALAIKRQINGDPRVEFLMLQDLGGISIGRKMDCLYQLARGAYTAGLGDDDMVAHDYVASLVGALEANPAADVVSFYHNYYIDGRFTALIKESVALTTCTASETEYHRTPSPKCAIRTEICRGFKHPDSWDGEDTEFARAVLPALKNEHLIPRVLYYYYYTEGNKAWRREQARRAHGA